MNVVNIDATEKQRKQIVEENDDQEVIDIAASVSSSSSSSSSFFSSSRSSSCLFPLFLLVFFLLIETAQATSWNNGSLRGGRRNKRSKNTKSKSPLRHLLVLTKSKELNLNHLQSRSKAKEAVVNANQMIIGTRRGFNAQDLLASNGFTRSASSSRKRNGKELWTA